MTALRNRRSALELSRLARTDHLTGIANRAQFELAIASEIQQAARTDECFTVLCTDLDGFKDVSDAHGHAAGDEVLREVSRRLQAQVREEDTVARLGGDEFGIVMRRGSAQEALALCERMVAAVGQPLALPTGHVVAVGISVGEATLSRTAETVDSLRAQADRALYVAKRASPTQSRRSRRRAERRAISLRPKAA